MKILREVFYYPTTNAMNTEQQEPGPDGALVSGRIDKNTLKAAIKRWGVDSQLEMIEEECLELALALQKLKRIRGNKEEKIKAVIDEIADVKIMIQQAEELFDVALINARVDYKMNRLRERILEGIA